MALLWIIDCRLFFFDLLCFCGVFWEFLGGAYIVTHFLSSALVICNLTLNSDIFLSLGLKLSIFILGSDNIHLVQACESVCISCRCSTRNEFWSCIGDGHFPVSFHSGFVCFSCCNLFKPCCFKPIISFFCLFNPTRKFLKLSF